MQLSGLSIPRGKGDTQSRSFSIGTRWLHLHVNLTGKHSRGVLQLLRGGSPSSRSPVPLRARPQSPAGVGARTGRAPAAASQRVAAAWAAQPGRPAATGAPAIGGGRPHGAACRTPPPAEARIRRGGPTERGSVSRTEPFAGGTPRAAGARAVTGVPSCASASCLAHHRDPGPGPNDRIRRARACAGRELRQREPESPPRAPPRPAGVSTATRRASRKPRLESAGARGEVRKEGRRASGQPRAGVSRGGKCQASPPETRN